MNTSLLRTAVHTLVNNPQKIRDGIISPKESYNSLKKKDKIEKYEQNGLQLNHAFGHPQLQINSENLGYIVEKSQAVLQEYLSGNRESLDELLNNRTYILVTGSPRTGGAFTTRKLRETLCEYDDNDAVVKNESLPTFDHLANLDEEKHRRQALYSLIQWLVWIDLRYSDQDYIVKKCSGFLHAMDFVYEFFDTTDLHIVVTTRHPASIYRSNDELEQDVIPIDDNSWLFSDELPDWWSDASDKTLALYYWQQAYNDFIQTLPENMDQYIQVVEYGKQESVVKDVVNSVAPERLKTLNDALADDPFRLTERDFSDFWYSSLTRSVLQDVESTWADNGFDMPVEHEKLIQ